MKILIISDTHGSHKNFDRVIEKERPLDMLIHLGDVEGDEDYIPAVADCPVHMVRGNNDFFSDLPGEEEFMVEGYHIFTTHGHGYYVSMGETRLKQEARGRGADIVMYGLSLIHISEPTRRVVISYAVFCLKKFFFNDTATTEIYTRLVVGSVRCV